MTATRSRTRPAKSTLAETAEAPTAETPVPEAEAMESAPEADAQAADPQAPVAKKGLGPKARAKAKAKAAAAKAAGAKPKPVGPKAKAKAAARKAAASGGDESDAPSVLSKSNAKQQLVRDSFTIPKSEYQALDQLKKRAMALEHDVRKGELLRAGLLALANMPDKPFLKTLKSVPTLKTGRPKREKPAAEADAAEE